jgi:uncharacterized protein YjiS (DUF1127 family)
LKHIEENIMSQISSFVAAGSGAQAAVGNKALQLVSKAVTWVAEQRRINRTMATLHNLSDATLRDIGIERGDIERVARHGRGA